MSQALVSTLSLVGLMSNQEWSDYMSNTKHRYVRKHFCIEIIHYNVKFRFIKKKNHLKWIYFVQRSQSILLMGMGYVQRGL